jgi:hypothetical protein
MRSWALIKCCLITCDINSLSYSQSSTLDKYLPVEYRSIWADVHRALQMVSDSKQNANWYYTRTQTVVTTATISLDKCA